MGGGSQAKKVFNSPPLTKILYPGYNVAENLGKVIL